MGNREALTLEYYDNFEDNEAFCDYVEDVLLSALKNAQPREPLPREQGPTIAEMLAADDSTASMHRPDSVEEYAADSDEDEDEPQYYWEKF